jgi:peptidoglycan hydrolase-like protein with peptidoglycan-binding domain
MVVKMQTDSESTGRLQVNVTGDNNEPIQNATVRVIRDYDGTDVSQQLINKLNRNISLDNQLDGRNDGSAYYNLNGRNDRDEYVNINETVVENVETDESGQTDELNLEAPDISLSLDESNEIRPYSKYTIIVSALGFESEIIIGAEILPDILAICNVKLLSVQKNDNDIYGDADINSGNDIDTDIETDNYINNDTNYDGVSVIIDIPPHTLYGDYPPKEMEPEISQMGEPGEIVLSRVVIPQTIVVHDGVPSDSLAPNYFVPYKDYIKNVASSEIYATWPRAAIEANVLAIMSFTLNRVYTEYYRNSGYDFTITSSTAYDQKWIYGRNVFEPISVVVDNIFNQYLSRPNVRQPILAQYCDGKKVTCPNRLSQWGACNLAQQGYSALEILKYYYGNTIYINSAEQISGIPASWPRVNLSVGSRGEKVRQMQEQLFTIAKVYSAIPLISVDGIFGEQTQGAVRQFQRIFNLPVTGIVDFATWYKISQIYVGIEGLQI